MSGRRTNQLVIQTPEGCAFSLLLAGPISRFLAWLIDLMCVMAAVIAVSIVTSVLSFVGGSLAIALMFVVTFLIWFGYGIVLEWFWQGRTVGKKLLRLRVMDEQGLRLSFSQVVMRNLLRFVDMMPAVFYMVGGVSCVITRHGQRLGDLVAGTVVVRAPKLVEPDMTKLLGGKFNSLREHPHLEARLRQRTAAAEARVAMLALVRRDELDAEDRLKLFADIAAHFTSIVEFPASATDGLSDEQYVRNVVDSLYRSRKGPLTSPSAGSTGMAAAGD